MPDTDKQLNKQTRDTDLAEIKFGLALVDITPDSLFYPETEFDHAELRENAPQTLLNVIERHGLKVVEAKSGLNPEGVEELVAFANAHQEWEANLIMNGDRSRGVVTLNQDLHDEFIKVQELRNKALANVKGGV